MESASDPSSVFELDSSVYRVAAIKKAAYKFGNRCWVTIESTAGCSIRITLRPKTPDTPLTQLEGAFRNEVLDQELREVVADETVAIRNLLLAQAFSAAALTGEVNETADYNDDPLEIRRFQHDNR
jgi:His-Xaa-Ser system protein HxsD